jgi:hypothetical protein
MLPQAFDGGLENISRSVGARTKPPSAAAISGCCIQAFTVSIVAD